jgi:hypothetical protein
MNHTKLRTLRVLAIAPSARGFGYAVMDGGKKFVDWGLRTVKGESKNGQALAKAQWLMARYLPDAVVVPNHTGARRAARIIQLTHEIVAIASTRKIRIRRFTRGEIDRLLFPETEPTKLARAEALARMFPEELAESVPQERKPWMNEAPRLYTFDAIALAVAASLKRRKSRKSSAVSQMETAEEPKPRPLLEKSHEISP